MKKLNIILTVLFGAITTVRAVNYPTYQPVVSAPYHVQETHAMSIGESNGMASSVQPLATYQPALNNDGSVVAPTVSSGPRREVTGPMVSPDSKCTGGGEHYFVNSDDKLVCRVCGASHNHYDVNGDKVCDECGRSCGAYAGTPGANAGNMIPIGDDMLPLLLLALMAAVVIAVRKKQPFS